MLAMADKHGEVWASVGGLADMARVAKDTCKKALEELAAPDDDSRTKEFDGRRIEAIDGGWLVLNYVKYRELGRGEDRREYFAEQKRGKRAAGKCPQMSTVSTPCPQMSPIAEAEAETKKKNININAQVIIGPTPDQLDICQPYPPGDVRVYPKARSAKVGLPEWIVHHPRCILGKDRDLWQGLFDYAGHETMSHAYERIAGDAKLWFSTFNDYIHANYEEDKSHAAQV